MKKLLLFAFGAMMAMPLMAQEEDVTKYIQNPGFDEDVTWGVNGETKPIVDESVNISDRSQAWRAADNSVYAHSLGTKTRKDDIPSTSAWNGFLGQVQGWTVAASSLDKPEWVYFGTVPYGLGERAIPIADDGDTCLQMPDKPEEDSGDDNKAALYLRAGWGGWATYSQVVSLPCAVYRLDYWVKNANFAASQNNTGVKNLCQVTCRKDVFVDNDGFNAQEWTKHSIEFTPTTDFTIQFGFQSSGGSGSNPFIWIDGIKLYKIDDADPMKVLEADLASMQGEIQELIASATDLGLEGLVTEMSDYIDEIDNVMGTDLEMMEAALKKAEADVETFRQAIDIIPDLDAVMDKMLTLIQTTQYPGYDDFNDAYEALNDLKTNGTAAQLLASVEQANAAIRTYCMSQEGSEENPADYTFLVQSPWFIKAGAEPTLQDGVWVYANEYSVGGGTDSNPDLTSDGWYKSGTETGGDQRVNFQQGRSCWNAWASNFTTTLGVAQDLTDLPSGYYTVSADLITQSGYCTNQHTFARSTAGSAISPSLTKDTWIDGDAGEWETLTTTEKVLVIDGKLTIGAEGTGSGSASAGWFLATNFHLYYLGQPEPDAIQKAVAAKIEAADAFAAKMHFAADRKAFQDSIAKAKAETDMYVALALLTTAQAEADKSEAKYDEYMMEGKTLPTVQAQLAGEGYEAATDIVKFAYDWVANWIVCDTATYTGLEPRVELLKNYVNTYTPAYNEAAKVAAKAMPTGKTYLEGIMAEQKAALVSEMKDAETVNAYVAKLQEAAAVVNKQNIVDDATATDYTAFILNPNAESMTGWELEKGTGDSNPSKSGQWLDGSDTRYFDSWNGSGLSGYKLSQLVKDLPNGTYTLGVYTRTPAEGAYVFYKADADTTFVEIPLNYYIDDEGVEQIASDTRGPIWEAARDAIEGGMTDADPNYATLNAIYNANNGVGRGFQHQEFQGIQVKNHELLIGTMTGTEASATEKVFGGNWYSVGGWTLTLTAKGDNTGWGGPIAEGIETVVADVTVADGIYSLGGQKVARLHRGLNIVVRGGKAQKILVK